jgi:hypothetical protein
VATTMGNNAYYAPMIMTIIDAKFQRFWQSCSDQSRVEALDFDAIDFKSQIETINDHGTIDIKVPLAVSRIIEADKKHNNPVPPPPPGGGAPSPKKPRGNGTGRGGGGRGDGAKGRGNLGTPLVKNPNINTAWALKPNEDYSAVFFNNLSSAPKFNGKAFCAMYHIRGFCYQGDECVRKSSHITFDPDMAAEVTTWIKACRATPKND